MDYQRYDCIDDSTQQYLDHTLPYCPFCGQYPHWLFNKNNKVIMCDKCKAKIRREYGNVIRVMGTGKKNFHRLKLNGTYYMQDLNDIAKNQNYSAPKGNSIPNNVYSEKDANVHKRAYKRAYNIILFKKSFAILLMLLMITGFVIFFSWLLSLLV